MHGLRTSKCRSPTIISRSRRSSPAPSPRIDPHGANPPRTPSRPSPRVGCRQPWLAAPRRPMPSGAPARRRQSPGVPCPGTHPGGRDHGKSPYDDRGTRYHGATSLKI
jgi:hypothetical protein